MRLILFDIDGTLLRTRGVGARAMERAGRQLLGPAFSLAGIDFGGALDPWIFQQAAERLGHADASHLQSAFHDAYLLELIAELTGGDQLPQILPGVAAALAALAADDTATLGLVTGNYARAAPLKLHAAGINPAQFVVGAFGGDAPTRAGLVRLAMQRWDARGGKPDPRHVVVIGDTPRDVDCAKQNGCRSIAVATGNHTTDQLAATGADAVLPDLTTLPERLRALWA